MSGWTKTRLMAVSETGRKTALVADVSASNPADLRPMVSGKRAFSRLTPDKSRTDLPDTSVVTVRRVTS